MKKRYKIKDGHELESFLFLLFFLFCWTGALSQSASAGLAVKTQKEVRPAYLKIASGWNISKFRDFATSPLSYPGHTLYTSLSHIDMNEKRASHTTLSYANGKYKKTLIRIFQKVKLLPSH